MEIIPPLENEEQKLIRILKEKGVENTEAVELLNKWIREEENRVDQAKDRPFAVIESNIRRARLYLASGYINEAYESLNAAATQAENENRQELFNTIIKEMEEIG